MRYIKLSRIMREAVLGRPDRAAQYLGWSQHAGTKAARILAARVLAKYQHKNFGRAMSPAELGRIIRLAQEESRRNAEAADWAVWRRSKRTRAASAWPEAELAEKKLVDAEIASRGRGA